MRSKKGPILPPLKKGGWGGESFPLLEGAPHLPVHHFSGFVSHPLNVP